MRVTVREQYDKVHEKFSLTKVFGRKRGIRKILHLDIQLLVLVLAPVLFLALFLVHSLPEPVTPAQRCKPQVKHGVTYPKLILE